MRFLNITNIFNTTIVPKFQNVSTRCHNKKLKYTTKTGTFEGNYHYFFEYYLKLIIYGCVCKNLYDHSGYQFVRLSYCIQATN
jgi:hypothetical protein